jgi:hypothetical protein
MALDYTTPILVAVAVVAIIGITVFIGNTVYLNIIRNQIKSPSNPLNKNLAAANVFFAFDIILIFILAAIFIWTIYVLVKRSYEQDEELVSSPQPQLQINTTPVKYQAVPVRSQPTALTPSSLYSQYPIPPHIVNPNATLVAPYATQLSPPLITTV